MNEKRPILSFCIPTYNRADFVVKSVKSILKYQGDDIEVVVSDNGSTDDTVKKLKEIHDNRLKISSNESNFGFEFNLVKVLKLAHGDFLFLLSDEDTILSEKINKLIKILKNENYGLIVTSLKDDNLTNANMVEAKNYNLKKLIKNVLRPVYQLVKYKRVITKKGYYVYYSKNSFNKINTMKLIFARTYLTGIILKRDLIYKDSFEVDCLLSEEYAFYPQVFLMLLISNKSKTLFTQESYAVRNTRPSHSYILDEKKEHGVPYPHPLSRYWQMQCQMKWLEELGLNQDEKKILSAYLFERFIYACIGNYERFTSENEKKLSPKELKKEAKYYLYLSRQKMKEINNYADYQNKLLVLGDDFLNKIIYRDLHKENKYLMGTSQIK